MITPRRTRLVRVPDLQSFRRVIAWLSAEPSADSAVIVPTAAARAQLRRTIADPSRGDVLPAIVTRDELYGVLAERLGDAPRRLSSFERDAMVRAAASAAAAAGVEPPFPLRPGLVAEILRFYDQLRRHNQSLDRFDEILTEALEGDLDFDRGAARMLQQTEFLTAVYRAYDARLRAAGLVDEHALRDRLVSTAPRDPLRHVIVTVPDWIAAPMGLFRADFDLLTRLPLLERIDVVATATVLASGFQQRLHDWLPGIEEVDATEVMALPGSSDPVLVAPADPEAPPVHRVRDREEELCEVARRASAQGNVLDRVAVVFKRPLPYLYLASEVFGSAALTFQTFDALPLAAQPFAAAVDLVLDFAASQFTRASLVALLRSPHFAFGSIDRQSISALDRVLSKARYLGELGRLAALAPELTADAAVAAPLAAALDAARALQPLLEPALASVQLGRLHQFLIAHSRETGSDRDTRCRSAILAILDRLAAARAAFGDEPATIHDLIPDIRRWIEGEGFDLPSTGDGLHLVDADAAPYGDFDEIDIVGLIEGEWPERPRRNIFYPPGVLATLGWPSEQDRYGGATAAFQDLLRSARARVAVFTFSLEDEALVEPSALVDEVDRAALRVERAAARTPSRIFFDERLSIDPPLVDELEGASRVWGSLRLSRTDAADERFHGAAAGQPRRPLSVGAIEIYLTCPFKFFAQHVLRLEDEPDDDEVMDPKEQGRFVHAVFQNFFAAWQAAGHGAIGPDTLDAARAMFLAIVEDHVARLPEAEASLERTRLLGSTVAPGLGDIVFRMEAERRVDVVERLLEYKLDGEFEFASASGPRTIALRGIADRLDLLADGTIRLIDYKLSSAPQKSRALQLPIYGLCAEQKLRAYRGRSWTLGEAAYIAFRGPKRITPLFTPRSNREQVMRDAQERLVTAVDGIEAGRFPPTPDDVFLCGFCSHGTVCRKDYVGDV